MGREDDEGKSLIKGGIFLYLCFDSEVSVPFFAGVAIGEESRGGG